MYMKNRVSFPLTVSIANGLSPFKHHRASGVRCIFSHNDGSLRTIAERKHTLELISHFFTESASASSARMARRAVAQLRGVTHGTSGSNGTIKTSSYSAFL